MNVINSLLFLTNQVSRVQFLYMPEGVASARQVAQKRNREDVSDNF